MTDIAQEKLKARLHLRGVDIFADAEFNKVAPWTRLTFGLCTGVALYATAFVCTVTLWLMVPVALWGAATSRHPFDHVYNKFVRRYTNTIELPRNGAPTRFACGLAAVCFASIAIAFHTGNNTLAYGLGAVFVAVGLLVTLTHFCVPGAVYQFLFGDRSLIKPAVFGGAKP
jgi:hypothetical protein